MNKEVKKFLEFNGKLIFFIAADGQYWIAIKPICEALGVQFDHQRILLKKDKILSQLPCNHMVVAADGKLREMVCLPEYFIYGWIFSIQSQSEDLQKFKFECYKVLYEYFHGAIGGRKDLLKEKAKLQIDRDRAMNSLPQDQALVIQYSEKRINAINAQLRKLDSLALEEEKTLFDS
jgi:hypothetical protein